MTLDEEKPWKHNIKAEERISEDGRGYREISAACFRKAAREMVSNGHI